VDVVSRDEQGGLTSACQIVEGVSLAAAYGRPTGSRKDTLPARYPGRNVRTPGSARVGPKALFLHAHTQYPKQTGMSQPNGRSAGHISSSSFQL